MPLGKKHSDIRARRVLFMGLLAVCLIVVFFVSFMLGRYPIAPEQLLHTLNYKITNALHYQFTHENLPLPPDWTDEAERIIFLVRLPRIIAAGLIGAALAAAGASYQGMFQNPMVSPDILGASTGAGFGAALALYWEWGYVGVAISSFSFGLLAVFVAYLISTKAKLNPVLGMVLAGIMISSLFSAFTSFIKLIADTTNVLPAITYWLMGSVNGVRMNTLIAASVPVSVGLITLFFLRWRINVMTMGEDEARSMGINTRSTRILVVIAATLVTAACVSISGMIGWIGLVIPHLSRMLVGYDYRILLPSAMLMGASFLIVVDNFSRLLTTTEIPLGILTAFVGAPFFLYLILRKGNEL